MRKDRNFSHIPCPHTCIAVSIINIPHQSTFVRTDEPTFPHHCYPKSIIHMKFYSVVDMYPSFIITCIHHYDIMQSIFTVLNILCALAPLTPNP